MNNKNPCRKKDSFSFVTLSINEYSYRGVGNQMNFKIYQMSNPMDFNSKLYLINRPASYSEYTRRNGDLTASRNDEYTRRNIFFSNSWTKSFREACDFANWSFRLTLYDGLICGIEFWTYQYKKLDYTLKKEKLHIIIFQFFVRKSVLKVFKSVWKLWLGGFSGRW